MANRTIAEKREIDQLKERLVAKDKVIAELVEHLATVYEYPRTVAYRKCAECGHEELIKARPNGCFTSSIDFCTKCEATWWDTWKMGDTAWWDTRLKSRSGK